MSEFLIFQPKDKFIDDNEDEFYCLTEKGITIDKDKMKWCSIRNVNGTYLQASDKIPPGPTVEFQQSMFEYRAWVKENVPVALKLLAKSKYPDLVKGLAEEEDINQRCKLVRTLGSLLLDRTYKVYAAKHAIDIAIINLIVLTTPPDKVINWSSKRPRRINGKIYYVDLTPDKPKKGTSDQKI